MGFNNCFFIISFIIYITQSRFVQGMEQRYDSDFLNIYFRNYAYNNVVRPRTGILYHLSLPSNFSGIEISFARFRTKSFYANGVIFSSIDIPPKTSPSPFVRRFDLIYENLGNWSSYYFNVPNYTLVSSVIGLSVYNDTKRSMTNNSILSLGTKRNPISIHFPRILLPKGEGINTTKECVRFGINGFIEITNMTSPNVCTGEKDGHFAVAVRSNIQPFIPHKKKSMLWKWWVIGFGVGIVGVVILALLGVSVLKFVKRRKIVQMEKEAEKSETLGTTWIGNSKLPSANGIRTQPVLINEEVP